MRIYVDEMPVSVRQKVIHYIDGKTMCIELEFDDNSTPTEICDTQSLRQQVREEVVGEIIEKLCVKHWGRKYPKYKVCVGTVSWADLQRVLKEIKLSQN